MYMHIIIGSTSNVEEKYNI